MTLRNGQRGTPAVAVQMADNQADDLWAMMAERVLARCVGEAGSLAGTQTAMRVLVLYESEARAFPHPHSTEALRAIARQWGSVVGVEAAEAFELIRSVR